jgi:hypothetical protein
VSTFRRLLGTAQKALDSKSTGSAGSGHGSDWRSMVRSAANSITGDSSASTSAAGRPAQAIPTRGGAPAARISETDRRAIARYDYLVRTAEPDQLERVHREAFENLTPDQRSQLATTMRSELPDGERPRSDAPQDLARSATRLGALDPRRLTKMLGRSGGGTRASGAGVLGVGAAGGLLAAVAGGAVVTSVGGSLLQDAVGAGIDVDALTADLEGELGDVVGSFEDVQGLDGMTDGFGATVTDAGEQVSGLGDRISDLGLGDLFGR